MDNIGFRSSNGLLKMYNLSKIYLSIINSVFEKVWFKQAIGNAIFQFLRLLFFQKL